MSKSILLPLVTLLFGAVTSAQLVITSLSQNGDLTWTNVVSNATYRVEFASSVAGPWEGFDAWSNLNSILASNSSVTVRVPLFYRVEWTDAPNPVGDWTYQGFDSKGMIMVTGQLSILSATVSGPGILLAASWDFQDAAPPTNQYRLELGQHITTGSLHFANNSMRFTIVPGLEQMFRMDGTFSGNTYTGITISTVGIGYGTFRAQRQANP